MTHLFQGAAPKKAFPAGHLHRRDIDFGMDAPIPVHWLGGHCQLTRFYDAMSITFPEAERAFIENVQFFRERIGNDTALRPAVTEFIAQEALHSREHRRYNRRLQAQGAPVARLERRLVNQWAFARRYFHANFRFATTVCLEHYTAMIADQLLRDPRNLASAHPLMADLWLWHALEETEHKAVAFDVFTAVVRGPIHRYLLRCVAVLFVVAPLFCILPWYTTFSLVRHDGRATDVRGWLQLLWTLFVTPGLFTRIIPHWLAWFRPGFHPWQHDNRALIERFAPRFDAKRR